MKDTTFSLGFPLPTTRVNFHHAQSCKVDRYQLPLSFWPGEGSSWQCATCAFWFCREFSDSIGFPREVLYLCESELLVLQGGKDLAESCPFWGCSRISSSARFEEDEGTTFNTFLTVCWFLKKMQIIEISSSYQGLGVSNHSNFKIKIHL